MIKGGIPESVFNLATTVQTALQTVQGDVTSVLAVVIPIALAIGGVIWVARKAFRWFKGMAG